jgi:hypothetical protein
MEPAPVFRRCGLVFPSLLAFLIPACEPPGTTASAESEPIAKPPAAVKRAEIGKNLVLETQGDKRRVRVAAEVVFREGPLEMFLSRNHIKDHESVLNAQIDARQLHTALLLTGAKPGHPVRFEPKYTPATGTTIKVMVEYQKDGKTVTIPGQDWVRDAKTRKSMPQPWVFAGSVFYPDQDDPKKPPLYAANGGDVICVANFPDAMLDLPINSPKDWEAGRLYEAFTERIPPLGTQVTVIFQPQPDKK